MVELGVVPIDGAVADGAVLREACRGVWRVIGRIEVLYVAVETVCWSSLETPPDVTCRAIELRMRTSKDKACRSVVELHAKPSVHVVAGLARQREAGAPMVHRFGCIEVVNVTRRALSRQAHEAADCGVDVAGVAGDGCVRANQRETRGVFLRGLYAILPASNIVAILAFRTKLTAMDVGMALGALRTNVAEHEFRVAQAACDFFVHAAQRKAGFAVVIKLRNRTNWRPTGRSVTAAARRLQRRPVRVAGRAPLHIALPLAGGHSGTRKREQKQELNDFSWG